jgi:hypothetical protein
MWIAKKSAFSFAVGGFGLAIEERHATHFRGIVFVAIAQRPTSKTGIDP